MPLMALFLLWAAMQIFFILRYGLVITGEAIKYLHEARTLLDTGSYSSANFLFYSAIILLIALCFKAGISLWWVAAIQIALNGISIICFYKIVRGASERRWIAGAATLYFLLLIYYHQFNTFLYTESLFFSLSIIYTYLLFSIQTLRSTKTVAALIVLAVLYFTRPTGVFFIPATALFIILKFYPVHARLLLLTAGTLLVLALFFVINYALGSGGEFAFMRPYIEGNVICGVPTGRGFADLELPHNPNSLQGLFYVVTQHFDIFSALAVRRLAAFFGAMRNFYSVPHNLFLAIYFYFLYAVIILKIRWLLKKNKAAFWFLITPVAAMAVTVALSCDEWSNRFLFSVTPCLLLMAAAGAGVKKPLRNGKRSAAD